MAYIFNDIDNLCLVHSLGLLTGEHDIYVSPFRVEQHENLKQLKLRNLAEVGLVQVIDIGGTQLFEYYSKERRKWLGLSHADFSTILYAKENGLTVITSNDIVLNCCEEQQVEVGRVKWFIRTVLNSEEGVNFYLALNNIEGRR